MINGHCECGRIQFEVDGDIDDFSHCNCSQCRRLHGAAYATLAGVARGKFRYLTGASDTRAYASSTTHERVFCEVCGSNIMVAQDEEPDVLYLSMRPLTATLPGPPGYHIFVGSKAPWHDITDDLDQYDEAPPQ